MKPKPKITFAAGEPTSRPFTMIAHEMYKRFGACYRNLLPLADTLEKRELLSSQLHELRSETRRLLTEANNG
jgi:hypothetical protein